MKTDPAIINKSAEKDAWIAKVSVEKPEELGTLLDEPTYKKFCEEHKDDH